MTRRERVLRALRHEPSDFPPYFVDFSPPLRGTLASTPLYAKDYLNYDLQICGYNYCGNAVPIGQQNIYRDDFGVIWDRSGVDKEIGLIHEPVIRDFDLSGYTFPRFDDVKFANQLKVVQKYREDRFFLAGIGFSLFERAWSLCSLEKVLLGMVVEKDFIHTLFSKICDFNLNVLDVILDFDVDAVYFGDDWGKSDGLIMGKKKWNAFIKPYLAKMYNKVKRKGKLIIQHSCGNIEEVLPDLIKMGVDCYQSFSPDVYNVAKIKETYGDDLCFWGGISAQKLLTSTNPESVVADTERNVRIMNRGGGFILSLSNALTNEYPLPNVLALLRYLDANNRKLLEQEVSSAT